MLGELAGGHDEPVGDPGPWRHAQLAHDLRVSPGRSSGVEVVGRGVGESGTALFPAGPSDVAICFRRRDDVRRVLGRAHFDLTSATATEQDSSVALALEARRGAQRCRQRPEEGHVVPAHPEGNEFSVDSLPADGWR
ncbi:VOC family protein [Janibacter sp. RAF20_2_2]|uniref:VOC family protein n=1 Tax=unclassified Janibacter TaxID=2649294 RepID=UPI003F92A460